MSTTDTPEVETTAVPEDDAVYDAQVPNEPADYRRALEVAALVLSLASVVLVFSGVGQAYATLHFSNSTSASLGSDLKYLANVLASPLLAILVLLTVAGIGATRAAWNDARARTRTVVPATAVLVVAIIVLAASVYDMVTVLTGTGTTLGSSGAAKFGQVTQDLFNVMLTVATMWIGTVLSRNAREDEDGEVNVDDSDSAAQDGLLVSE